MLVLHLCAHIDLVDRFHHKCQHKSFPLHFVGKKGMYSYLGASTLHLTRPLYSAMSLKLSVMMLG